jgi:hypothetical protein
LIFHSPNPNFSPFGIWGGFKVLTPQIPFENPQMAFGDFIWGGFKVLTPQIPFENPQMAFGDFILGGFKVLTPQIPFETPQMAYKHGFNGVLRHGAPKMVIPEMIVFTNKL